jgi:hypothetical protein
VILSALSLCLALGAPLQAGPVVTPPPQDSPVAASSVSASAAPLSESGAAGGVSGSAKALSQARLDYAQGRPDAALAELEGADALPRDASIQPEWLYWRGQSRLALKLWGPAEEDLRQLRALWPGDPYAEAAELGVADCEAALREDDAAGESYSAVAQGKGAFVAQALWGLGILRLRQGRLDEARGALVALRTDYPESFEAQSVGGQLDKIAALRRRQPPAPLAARLRGRWSVQVGAYSRLRWASDLARQLRRHHFRVKVHRKNLDGRVLYLVQVGPYGARSSAAAAAEILQSREKLPYNLVAE